MSCLYLVCLANHIFYAYIYKDSRGQNINLTRCLEHINHTKLLLFVFLDKNTVFPLFF